MDLCMILEPKVGVLQSFVAKILGNTHCTDTSVQPATVEVRECSYVCVVLGSQSELCARYGDFK